MLTILQKAAILTRAGITLPSSQALRPLPGDAPERQDPSPFGAAWERAVEILYVAYTQARAARSLREAEEGRQMDRLREVALHLRATRGPERRAAGSRRFGLLG